MRDPLDRYYTPAALAAHCVRFMVNAIGCNEVAIWREPFCGEGAFSNAIQGHATPSVVVCTDIDPSAGVVTMDAAQIRSNSCDYVASNPPYQGLIDHIKTARRISRKGTGLLLRHTALGGQGRIRELWEQDPPSHILHIRQRPVFGLPGGEEMPGTDNCDSVFVVWDDTKQHTGTQYVWGENWREPNTKRSSK